MRETYDYIVVGSGSAGSVVAARLSEDPALKVLVVEAGGSERTPIIAMPAALPFVYQNKRIQWGFQSGPEPELGGRSIDEKAGKVLGGTSSINAMIYNRGNPLDYDGWAEDGGLPTWAYANCLPYFKRMEAFAGGADDFRGGTGPMRVTRCAAEHKLYDAFLASGEQAGYAVTPDHNGFRQEGLHIAQASISSGLRWGVARGYLRPALRRGNLELLRRTHVTRVVIEAGRATGIEVADGSATRRISCAREVVLCAGAFGSPKLLMLSGIGPADGLRAHGIDVVSDVPGVGRNLENHPGVDIQWGAGHKDSLTAQLGPVGQARLAAEWALLRRGLGASNWFEAGAFLRTRDDVSFPNVQYEFLALTRKLVNGRLVPVPGFQFWMDLSRPLSRGRVRLRTSEPTAAPSIVFNHLAERQDILDLVGGIRLVRDVVGQRAWSSIGHTELAPGPEATSDADLEAFVRTHLGTSYHPSGTCRMGTGEQDVVDEQARVRGVDGLRVVDASVMPRVVTANLNAPTMMLAERLADAIVGKPALTPSTVTWYRAGVSAEEPS